MKQSSQKSSLVGPILINVILFALGICMIIWADKVTSFISISIGALFILYALYTLIAFFRSGLHNIGQAVTATALAIAGIYLIVENTFLASFVSHIIGAFIIITSMFKIQDAFMLRKFSASYKTPLILAVLSLCCGVFCISGPLIVPNFLIQALGIILIVYALTHSACCITIKHAPTVVEQEAIEAEIVEKKGKKRG